MSCFKIVKTIRVVFVTLASDERRHNGGFVKIHSCLRPLPAIFSAILCFIGLYIVRIAWVVQLSSKGQRRHAPLVTIHRIGSEDNKQTTNTMDPSSETMELRGNKNE